MSKARTMIPHCMTEDPVIDAFQCSRCEWSYSMKNPKRFVIDYEDANRACWQFDQHRCKDFESRMDVRPTHKASGSRPAA